MKRETLAQAHTLWQSLVIKPQDLLIAVRLRSASTSVLPKAEGGAGGAFPQVIGTGAPARGKEGGRGSPPRPQQPPKLRQPEPYP